MKGMERLLAPMRDRVRGMIARGLVQRVDDAPQVQALQVELLEGETAEGVEHFQGYGLTSVQPSGAELEALVAFVGGLRSHGVVVAMGDRKYRIKLEPGEVALYDDQGQAVKIGRDGIEIVTTKDVTVTAENVKVIADRVDLGGEGGAKVARVGDPVSGGVITDGSAKVFAA